MAVVTNFSLGLQAGTTLARAAKGGMTFACSLFRGRLAGRTKARGVRLSLEEKRVSIAGRSTAVRRTLASRPICRSKKASSLTDALAEILSSRLGGLKLAKPK